MHGYRQDAKSYNRVGGKRPQHMGKISHSFIPPHAVFNMDPGASTNGQGVTGEISQRISPLHKV